MHKEGGRIVETAVAELENLDGDAKGKGASGSRESEGKGDQIKGNTSLQKV